MGREEDSGLVQNTSSPDSKEETRKCQKPYYYVNNPNLRNVLRYCFVNVRPKDRLEAKSVVKNSAKQIQEVDQRLHLISESLREKAIDREKIISKLKCLQSGYKLDRLIKGVEGKKNLLIHLYKALDIVSSTKSCSISQEKLQKHKLNFRMQHKVKNQVQEKNLLRDINVSQEMNSDSTSPMEELGKLLWGIQGKYGYYHHHYNQNKCEKLDEEIKQFHETRKITKGLRETVRSQVKVICDELMETRKKKRAIDAEIKVAEKELKAKNQDIWSFHQRNLKGEFKIKEASLYLLKKIGNDWVFRFCNMEDDSMHYNTIIAENLGQVIRIFSDRFNR